MYTSVSVFLCPSVYFCADLNVSPLDLCSEIVNTSLPQWAAECNVHGSTAPPPEKYKYFMVKSCICPPLAGPSRQVQARLGLGLGVQGQGQAERGWGVRECREDECWNSWPLIGRLPDHSLPILLKNVNFRYRPATAPFGNNYILNYRPVTAPTKEQ